MASPSADQTPREPNADRIAPSDAPSDAPSAAADDDNDDDDDDESAVGGWTPRAHRSSDHVVTPAGTGVAAALAEVSPNASNLPNRAHQP